MSVASVKITSADTQAVAAGGKVLGVHLEATGTAGLFSLNEGGTSGAALIELGTAAAAGNHYVPVPGGGINFGTDMHVKLLTNITSVTIFYENN